MHPATKSPALIPTATRPLPLAVAASGARIFDESGLDYIDASSGPLAVSLGHGHPKVLKALRDQFAAVDYVHRTQFRNAAAERLADLVTARLGEVWQQIACVHPAIHAGHTFTNSPLACAAGIATIEVIEEEGLLQRVTERGAWLGERLRALQQEFPFVGDVRGIGYMWGSNSSPTPRRRRHPIPRST
jgi:adenosylmethionine-8-amino-7-oxononanoate aminotransferase